MPKFHSLFSGSKGNASVIRSGGNTLLIDAGMTCKQLLLAMKSRDIDPCSISGILITHTHSDHIKGLRVLCKNIPAKVYAAEQSISTLLRNGHITEEQFGGVCTERNQSIGDFVVSAFPTEHDSEGSCGYCITTPDNRVCSVCTDLGRVTDTVHNAIEGSDLVLLESNYDPDMLRCGCYPDYLKKRISGNEGHLSNRDCAVEAERLIESGTTRLVLGHLSEENNTPYLAKCTALERLDRNYICGSDYLLYVAEREGLKETVIF